MLVDYLPYDVTMFWLFFLWEQYNIGHIYLQCFPRGKLYAGQSINIVGRMYAYSRGIGSNDHHSNAIKKHGWTNVKVLTIECPLYMLDTVEKFLIEYYDLTDPDKGYNKTTGGRKNWEFSKETRAKMTASAKAVWERDPERRIEHSARMSIRMLGANNPMFGYKWTPEQLATISASCLETWAHDPVRRVRMSGAGNPMFDYEWTPEQLAKMSASCLEAWARDPERRVDMSTRMKEVWEHDPERRVEYSTRMSGKTGELHPRSKPVCVFGKVYPAALTASDALRADHVPKSDYNFIAKWTRKKKHQPYTFYVTKKFYEYAVENDIENITRDLYDNWIKM